MLSLAAGDYRLELMPERGGSIARFDWRGEPLMRPTCGPSILDMACFPLVPFSNRIAFGRFVANGHEVRLAPNFPHSDHPHPLHGFGWLDAWDVAEPTIDHALLRHICRAGEWPWAYGAQQELTLSEAGLSHRLAITNMASSVMPAGLGVHPYFPRTNTTRYLGRHRGEWRTTEDGLPIAIERRDRPLDWWAGAPVTRRHVDTAYAERCGPLRIAWPERGIGLEIRPSEQLSFTVVFVPSHGDFFCVEPVSHSTDAINDAVRKAELVWLQPGESFSVTVDYRAFALR